MLQATDPFSCAKLSMGQVKPNAGLHMRIRAYLAERGADIHAVQEGLLAMSTEPLCHPAAKPTAETEPMESPPALLLQMLI